MANIKSEQLRSDLSLEINYDQPLTIKNIINKTINILGKENCEIIKILNKKVLCYKHDNKKEILLKREIRYLM